MDETQLLRLLDETRREVEKAETKASILLAGASLGIGTMVSVLLSGEIGFGDFGSVTKVLFTVSSVLMLAGLIFLGFALIPRLTVNPAQTPTLAYFGHVVDTGSCSEFERMAALPNDERLRLTNQIWTLSLVTIRKYRHIVHAFHCFGAAIGTGLLAYIANVGGV